MANLSAIKLPNGTTYSLKDSGALQLTGGQVTGPVSFGDSVNIDDATVGSLVVNGGASFTNNIQANTINGVTVGSSPKFTDTNTVTTATTTGSGNAVTAVTASNGALTITKGTTFLTSHQDISGKADKATTLAGYGITDAKIANGVITLGSNTITPLTSHNSYSITDSGSGNAVTEISLSGTTFTVTKGTTFLTRHQNISGKADKTATVSNVAYNSTSKKITKTINGTTTDVVTVATLKTALGYTASDVGALPSSTTYVSTVTTSAGVHTAISSKSGTVSFNVPTKTSHLTNDSGFITSYTDTKVTQTPLDGTNSMKNVLISYGLNSSNTNTVYASTYMKYNDSVPCLSLINRDDSTYYMDMLYSGLQIRTGSYLATLGAITQSRNHTVNLPDASGTIALTSDIPTSLPASDVSAWAKASSKPTYTASEVGAVPTTRTVNGKALSSDISLVPSDIGAAASSDIPTVSTITVNTTTTKGTFVGTTCYKYGRVVTLTFRFRNTSSTASGADLYTGTLSSTLPLPYDTVTSVTYYGAHALVGVLLTDRSLTIRNASNSALQFGSSNTASMSFTYVCQ